MITCQAQPCLSQCKIDELVTAVVFSLVTDVMKDILKISKYKNISRGQKASISIYSVS